MSALHNAFNIMNISELDLKLQISKCNSVSVYPAVMIHDGHKVQSFVLLNSAPNWAENQNILHLNVLLDK